MRQPTTAEVRLNEHKQRVSAQRGPHLAVLAVNEVAVIEFRCRGTPWGRKIATNNFGIREMSAKVREQLLAPDYKSRRFLRHFASRAILYDFFIASGQDRARRFMGAVAFIGVMKQTP